jgi:hypothetical protein
MHTGIPHTCCLRGTFDSDIDLTKRFNIRIGASKHVMGMIGRIDFEKSCKLLLLVKYGFGFFDGIL